MLKKYKLIALSILFFSIQMQAQENYKASSEILQARTAFQDMKFGMFVHWGIFSIPGSGEWVMNNRKIRVQEYTHLKDFYNPVAYNPKQWVSMAKAAGMKYITFVTRHHDGFSNWDTKMSDWKITNTPYKKDVLKMLADECRKQDIKLCLYYSLLDWTREDYPWRTGRTGQFSGRTGKGDYNSYLQFMKGQLTELLTNYGEIGAIWFDGHWDQTNAEGHQDLVSRIDWKYDEIYSLIHQLQPQCMIGNNHHQTPFPGEDFQMFERDLPGENSAGLSFQIASDNLPLETCETMNGSWGFDLADHKYKSAKTIIRYLVGAAGRNANLLLNIGPMPNGAIQQEFLDTLYTTGDWLNKYGQSIYGTRGAVMAPQKWGLITANEKAYYIHILQTDSIDMIELPLPEKKLKATALNDGSEVKLRRLKNNWQLLIPQAAKNEKIDYIIEIKK
ncbi:MAG TPA: alpha-L-fucosidase [Niabella sp.]|nr:alpha-L-fucosidase [Niabella sp.]HOZ96625.1 alpha-L-fucosidase [Niabella sp.]HQW14507.1 alpha-L-fucosidase [Niabella sp.]HQX19922.1 alpha-L-fucosidase [Niabella sp.]HQX41529.1 alpha-L-fucosidase [Niabella sp.]